MGLGVSRYAPVDYSEVSAPCPHRSRKGPGLQGFIGLNMVVTTAYYRPELRGRT